MLYPALPHASHPPVLPSPCRAALRWSVAMLFLPWMYNPPNFLPARLEDSPCRHKILLPARSIAMLTFHCHPEWDLQGNGSSGVPWTIAVQMAGALHSMTTHATLALAAYSRWRSCMAWSWLSWLVRHVLVLRSCSRNAMCVCQASALLTSVYATRWSFCPTCPAAQAHQLVPPCHRHPHRQSAPT
jgi:hypothetical protein